MSHVAEKQASISETQQLLQRVLQQDGHQSACFVAHSFGTIVVSWLLNSSDPEVRALVKVCSFLSAESLRFFRMLKVFSVVSLRSARS